MMRPLRLPADAVSRPLNLLDVGARGGMQWPWDQVAPEQLQVLLVEPDPVEAQRLRGVCERAGRGVVVPTALWREDATLDLSVNESPGTSSVFMPNRELLSQFPDAARYEPRTSIRVTTRTIDGLAREGRLGQVDFMKIDVQGAELAILEGGAAHLSTGLVGLEVEVEFCELYLGQPLFADVDRLVRGWGLELWDIRKTFWKYDRGRHAPGSAKGRLIFGDALYLRPLTGLRTWLAARRPEEASEKFVALIMSALAYGYTDYAAALLETPLLVDQLSVEVRQGLQRAVRASGRGVRPFKDGNRYLYAVFEALSRAFRPCYDGWVSGSEQLGSRRRGPFWF